MHANRLMPNVYRKKLLAFTISCILCIQEFKVGILNKEPHPGLVLQEKINSMHMSRSELAARTGVTEKHISTVITQTSQFKMLAKPYAIRAGS